MSKGTPLAKACADKIRRDVVAAPGNRWVKTGKLLASIDAQGSTVVVSGDRLARTELGELFAAECVKDPTDDKAFVDAIDKAVTKALGGKKNG